MTENSPSAYIMKLAGNDSNGKVAKNVCMRGIKLAERIQSTMKSLKSLTKVYIVDEETRSKEVSEFTCAVDVNGTHQIQTLPAFEKLHSKPHPQGNSDSKPLPSVVEIGSLFIQYKEEVGVQPNSAFCIYLPAFVGFLCSLLFGSNCLFAILHTHFIVHPCFEYTHA